MISLNKTLRELRERGLENTFQRFYSFYQATLTDIADEAQLGRGHIRLESLGYPEDHPDIADVLTPYGGEDFGFYFPPYKGDEVYVSFDHGDISSPMIVGSSWGTRGDAMPKDSDVPAEFVQADGSAPVVRGIKVKVGSALLFDETVDKVKVEMFTGASQGVGKASEQHHKVSLDDTKGEEKVVITTFGGHSTTWQDKDGEVFVKTLTTAGHEIFLDDTGEKIFIKTKDGHQATFDDGLKKIEVLSTGKSSIVIDDNMNSITAKTVGGNMLTLDDALKKIEGLTTGGRIFSMNDLTQQIQLVSPTPPQAVTMSPITGTNISDASPGGVTLVATTGPLVGTGQGVALASAGGAPALIDNSGVSTGNFTGLETRNLIGGSVQTITGTWNLAGPFIASINALFLFLGTGMQLRLVNEDFFATAYNAHYHVATAVGAPTTPPVFGFGIVGTHTTIQTLAS
jgi:type VI secretion system (T6SS) baseplate-like injector VgrG